MKNFINKSDQIAEGLRTSLPNIEYKMTNRMRYGYRTQLDGEYVINEKAKVVRWIFNRYLSCDILDKTANGRKKQDVLSLTEKDKLKCKVISELLANEKNVGSILRHATISLCGVRYKMVAGWNGIEQKSARCDHLD